MPDTEPARPFGRSLKDFDAEATESGLLPAEETLREAARRGEACQLGLGRPKESGESNRIRAGFLRFLALGGDTATPVHERGIELYGAYIDDELDLEGCTDIRPLLLALCRVTGEIILGDARTRTVNLSGSRIGGLVRDRAWIAGGLFLRQTEELAFLAEREVRLSGAEIGGDLDCNGGQFANPKGDALICDGIKVGSDVFLNHGFSAEGTVRFVFAEISGTLDCNGGRFKNIRPGDNPTDCNNALHLQGARIGGALILARGGEPNAGLFGSVNLELAHATTLVDLPGAWPPETVPGPGGENLACHIHLDGFTYDRLYIPGDAETRKGWLHRQRPSDLCEEFKPQPFEQLAKVYRAMGHEGDAKKIAIEKHRLALRQRRPNLQRIWPILLNAANYALRWLFLEKLIGHGYQPHRAVFLALAVWLVTSMFFYQVKDGGGMAPSDPRVFLNDGLVADCAGNWATCTHSSMENEHTPFQPALYALDVLLPLAPLGQESAWAPMASHWRLDLPGHGSVPISGWVSLGVMWFNIGFGWMVGLLLAAVVGGVVKQN